MTASTTQSLQSLPFSFAVTKSKCPSYVGVTGILLQETKHVFKIITKEDHLKGVCCVPRVSDATISPFQVCLPVESNRVQVLTMMCTTE